MELRGVSDLWDRGSGFKSGSQLLAFTRAVTEFSEPYTLYSAGKKSWENDDIFREFDRSEKSDESCDQTEFTGQQDQ